MNYTINYAGSTPVGQVPQIPVCPLGQRTIVLTPPTQQPSSNGSNSGSNNQQPSYPLMMQVGGLNAPVFYTYQTPQAGKLSNSHANETSSSNNSGISQMMLAPVSPSSLNIQGHGNSPTVPTVNIRAGNKSTASQSLGEIFNMQAVNNVLHTSAVVQSKLPVCQAGQSSDLAMLLSSLQVAGLQIVETTSGNGTAPISVSVVNGNVNAGENTVSIGLPNANVDEKSSVGESHLVNNGGLEQMYRIVDRDGSVTMITTGIQNSTGNDSRVNSMGTDTSKGQRKMSQGVKKYYMTIFGR